MPTPSAQKWVVMVGTALEGRGGMSSVVATYRQQGLFDRAHVKYLQVHDEVSGLGKALLVWRGVLALLGWLLTGQVALLHIHTASGVSFWRKSVFALLGRVFACPVIVHVHGGEFLEFYQRSSPLGRWFVRWTLEGAARVLVLSDTWRQRLQTISPRLRLDVVANPVLLPTVVGVREASGRGVHFLFLGRLERDKGVFELLDAFSQVCVQFPDAHLVLAGDGDVAAVKAQVARLGLVGKVDMPGWVSGVIKSKLLRSADIFVLPSYIEGLPVSMLEAMACGVPVVVSRVGSVPEVLSDGVNGLMVEPKSVESLHKAMAFLAASATSRKQLGAAGQELVALRYGADGVCGHLMEIYATVLKEVLP